jgi:hypothetical protein
MWRCGGFDGHVNIEAKEEGGRGDLVKLSAKNALFLV